MSRTPVIIGGIVAAVAVIVCIVLAVLYHSQEDTLSRQLAQVEQQQAQAAKTSQQANTARLGICWSSTEDSSTFDLQSVQIESPIVAGGVYQCPSGTNFVSVVPVSGG
jgi:hypothetical protein